MKCFSVACAVIILTSCASQPTLIKDMDNQLWVSERNFKQLPLYDADVEFASLPEQVQCNRNACDSVQIEAQTYVRAIQISSDNVGKYLIGVWTGSECSSDFWALNKDASFEAQYPLPDGNYSWHGRYSLDGDVYREEGTNNSETRELNEAKLFYVPARDQLIYKGIRSFDGYNADGSIKYIEFSGPEYIYLERCE